MSKKNVISLSQKTDSTTFESVDEFFDESKTVMREAGFKKFMIIGIDGETSSSAMRIKDVEIKDVVVSLETLKISVINELLSGD